MGHNSLKFLNYEMVQRGSELSFVSGILLLNLSKEDLEQAQGSKEQMRG